jgi:hypothetical protein
MSFLPRLTAVVCLVALAACTNASSSGSSDEPPQEADITTAPPFSAGGAGSAVKVKDLDATLVPPSPALAKILADMSKIGGEQNVSFYAGTYKLAASDLAQWDEPLNDHWAQNNMAFDLMFRIDGSKAGDKTGFGWAAKWSPDSERVSCQIVKDQKKAFTRFSAFQAFSAMRDDKQASSADHATLENGGRTAVGSMLKDLGGAKLYKCHWDNTDDTDTDALVTIDAKSGEVRVLVAFTGA